MHPTLLTVDSAAGLCLIFDSIIPAESRPYIELIGDIRLRSATDHRLALKKMIKLYFRLRDAIFPFYFGIVSNLPPKSLVGTSFIDKKTTQSSQRNRLYNSQLSSLTNTRTLRPKRTRHPKTQNHSHHMTKSPTP